MQFHLFRRLKQLMLRLGRVHGFQTYASIHPSAHSHSHGKRKTPADTTDGPSRPCQAATSVSRLIPRRSGRSGTSTPSAYCLRPKIAVQPRRNTGRSAAPAPQPSTISLILWARSAMTNGLVMTSMPGSRWPFPTAAFSAKPVTNRTLSPGLVTRAASAT